MFSASALNLDFLESTLSQATESQSTLNQLSPDSLQTGFGQYKGRKRGKSIFSGITSAKSSDSQSQTIEKVAAAQKGTYSDSHSNYRRSSLMKNKRSKSKLMENKMDDVLTPITEFDENYRLKSSRRSPEAKESKISAAYSRSYSSIAQPAMYPKPEVGGPNYSYLFVIKIPIL